MFPTAVKLAKWVESTTLRSKERKHFKCSHQDIGWYKLNVHLACKLASLFWREKLWQEIILFSIPPFSAIWADKIAIEKRVPTLTRAVSFAGSLPNRRTIPLRPISCSRQFSKNFLNVSEIIPLICYPCASRKLANCVLNMPNTPMFALIRNIMTALI